METEIRKVIEEALTELELDEGDFVVEHPTDLTYGDYATNVALVAAKRADRAPRELAEELAASLDGKLENVDRIEVAGPGFINFFLTRDFFTEKISEARERGYYWGSNENEKGTKVLVEKSAPNLYKPFHVGHLLNITIGESLSRLTRQSGANVIDIAYPSDISLGVAKAVWSLIQTGGDPTDIRALGDAYVAGTKAYDEDGNAKAEITSINKELNTTKSGPVWDAYQQGRDTSLRYFKNITSRLKSDFADIIYESEAGVVGKTIVAEHTPDIFTVSEGAVVFVGEEYGLHTRVFVTSLGLPLYEAKDIGLVKIKFEKYNPDLSIVITDVEQKQYFEVIKKAAELVFGEWGERSLYWHHGRLRFADGKVSSRLGNVPLAETLLDEVAKVAKQKIVEADRGLDEEAVGTLAEDVAIGAIKYSFLRVAPGQNIIFDFDQALSFEGDSGPYLMYTHARICSVMEKAGGAGIAASLDAAPEEPYEVEKILYQFPEVVARAASERAPHYVATYLIELAGAFNTFYAKERIADPDDEYAPYKLALSEAVKVTLQNGLWSLGISAPEEM